MDSTALSWWAFQSSGESYASPVYDIGGHKQVWSTLCIERPTSFRGGGRIRRCVRLGRNPSGWDRAIKNDSRQQRATDSN
ncbi:hypothetical protein CYLTODRAFT_416225 [Cylindrobasidium torrendii FP15055 ss-10]|uniref:Uncharacterized protein n=1 Tax=Cylindrobasidium torrendii FP15055 ss-10 TaxID=1314674 RepID=A0A0D7BXK6_9AGAR|nr:hypothetical protein CYLTODRAFT_416225 [Cylindrobasidium torrendii FP15055 ss-10]